MKEINKTTKKTERINLEELKRELSINDKNQEINSLNELLGKKLARRSYTIYWFNLIIFIILCASCLLFFISPVIIWMCGLQFGTEPYTRAFKIALAVGLPTLLITALYDGLVFWVFMVKCCRLEHAGHKIHLYLGVRIVVLCVDERIVAYCKYGYFTVPTATWCAELDDGEMIRFQLQGKNKYELDINWYSDSTFQRFIEQKNTDKDNKANLSKQQKLDNKALK